MNIVIIAVAFLIFCAGTYLIHKQFKSTENDISKGFKWVCILLLAMFIVSSAWQVIHL